LLAPAAILVAFFVAWFAGIILSFQHLAGFTGRHRILQFFEPGTRFWGVAVLVALGLLGVGRRFGPVPRLNPAPPPAEGAKNGHARLAELLPIGLVVAGAGVTVSAFVGVLVELSNFGNGIDSSFSGLINYLGIMVLGLAGTWWAFRETVRPSHVS
jgi:hypothetical protein